MRAYPGLRVDVATDVDHVLEGLCVSRRHGQLRVAMGTERRVPIKRTGFQGVRVSEPPLISAGGTPRGALCAACCASETLKSSTVQSLCSATRRGDQRGRQALRSRRRFRRRRFNCVFTNIMCCLKQTIYSTARRVDEAPRACNPTAPPPKIFVQSYMFAH